MNVFRVFSGFFIFFAFAIYFKMILKRAGKNNKKELKEYIQEEHDSLFARKRKIDEELFLKPNMDAFPIALYTDISELSNELRSVYNKQCAVIKKSNTKMLYLKDISNLELKKRFGYANLETISDYEQNFQSFVFAVYDWAVALNKAGLIDSAITALEAVIEFGSNYSKSFMLLADLYFNKKDTQKLRALLDKVSSLDDVIQNRVKSYINNYLS